MSTSVSSRITSKTYFGGLLMDIPVLFGPILVEYWWILQFCLDLFWWGVGGYFNVVWILILIKGLFDQYDDLRRWGYWEEKLFSDHWSREINMDHNDSNIKKKKMKEYSKKADFAMLVGPVTDERPACRIFSFLVIVPAIFIIILSSFFLQSLSCQVFLLSSSRQYLAANLTLATATAST